MYSLRQTLEEARVVREELLMDRRFPKNTIRFWLKRETDTISLDQLLKAVALLPDYTAIRAAIHGKLIIVNGIVVTSRRKTIVAGDVVEYGPNVILVRRDNEGHVDKKRREREPEPADYLPVVHTQTVKTWVEKPLKEKVIRKKRDPE